MASPGWPKNVLDTGNPVYPLGYAVFGGRDWNPDRDAQWSAAHGPQGDRARRTQVRVGRVDVAGRSDWQSPLYAALAPLAFLRRSSRRAAAWLAFFSAYLFLTWWLLTHRLDRFWLPILPPLAILAGLGADWVRSKTWLVLLSVVMGVSIATNAAYCSTALAGLNERTGDSDCARPGVPKMLNPPLARLDAELPPGAKPLLVGQAAVFHLNRPIVYNTVFNNETIETLVKGRTPEQVGEELRGMGVTHIYVDWFEIERYRSPGNYGFTRFVTPEIFARLVKAGVLEEPTRIGQPARSCIEVQAGPIAFGVESDGIIPSEMDARTVVTGGAGFIGSHLVGLLVERGGRVVVVERPGADASHLPSNVEVVRADIRDREATRRAVEGAQFVYLHLAYNPNPVLAIAREFDAVNHRGTIHVLDAALAGGAERVVARQHREHPHPRQGDRLDRRGCRDRPLRRRRPLLPVEAPGRKRSHDPRPKRGPRRRREPDNACQLGRPGHSPPTRLIRDFCNGRLPARMDCTLNLIDVRDIAEGLFRAMERGRPGRRYLLGGENLTLVALLGHLSRLSGVPVPRWSVPYPIGLAVAVAGEFWADHVSGKPPKATVTGVRLTRRIMNFDASDSLRELGLTPRPINQSLLDAVLWLRQTRAIDDRPVPFRPERVARLPRSVATHNRLDRPCGMKRIISEIVPDFS